MRFRALDFFAGSGLVTLGLAPAFDTVWANDICPKKARTYAANHGAEHLHLGSVAEVRGADLPGADLAWASFPCQDLSAAGRRAGIHGERSGLVWDWLRVLDAMPERPKIAVAENVVGLLTANGGADYRTLHAALTDRGYRVGTVLLDAIRWVPQSRPRVFVIAVRDDLRMPEALLGEDPGWAQPPSVVRAQARLPQMLWWDLPEPAPRETHLADLIIPEAPVHAPERTHSLLGSLSAAHADRVRAVSRLAAAGYVRTRLGVPRLELRFDGVAGCLRTPKGGSSKQVLLMKAGADVRTRTLTAREAARLMGAPDSYALPGSETDGYAAMGDAVAVPVTRFLAERVLAPVLTAQRA